MEAKQCDFLFKNNKTILLIIPILLFLTALVLLAYVFLSFNKDFEPEGVRNKQVSCPDFTSLDEVTNYLEEVFEKYELYEYEKTSEKRISTEKYEGMRWEDDDGEIGLIKEYNHVHLDIYYAVGVTNRPSLSDEENYKPWMEIRDEKERYARKTLPLVFDELEQCFLNGGFVEGEDNVVENILAFQKEGFKCLARMNVSNWPSLVLNCGNIEDIDFPEGYSEINKFFGRNRSVHIYNLVDDLAVITSSPRTMGLGGAWGVLQRDRDGNWTEAIVTQEGWDCNSLFDLGVSPKLFDGLEGICYDYTVKDFQSPERTREYSDFYEEKKN